jgi:nucleotide-binding universal stress UspA family protein
MPVFKTIVCPTDYSAEARHALSHATAIAKWYEAKLIGVHAYQPLLAAVPEFGVVGYSGDPLPDTAAFKTMEQDLAGAMENARQAGVHVDTHLEVGNPVTVILDAAASFKADLIVIGTHGAGGFEHLVLGSVTEKVLRKAKCPVMTVPPHARTTSKLPFKHVLCSIDFSDASTAALRFALSMAQEADAELTILHVLEPADDEPLTNRPINVPEYAALRQQDAAERLARLVPDGANNWCTTKTRIAHGKAYREILAVSAQESADLIVMGVHGRNALELMLFGSTTNQVVRRATCPVLTVRI